MYFLCWVWNSQRVGFYRRAAEALNDTGTLFQALSGNGGPAVWLQPQSHTQARDISHRRSALTFLKQAARSNPEPPCGNYHISMLILLGDILSGNWINRVEFFWTKPFVFGVITAAACFLQLCSPRHAERSRQRRKGGREASQQLPPPMFLYKQKTKNPHPKRRLITFQRLHLHNLKDGKITGCKWESTAP